MVCSLTNDGKSQSIVAVEQKLKLRESRAMSSSSVSEAHLRQAQLQDSGERSSSTGSSLGSCSPPLPATVGQSGPSPRPPWLHEFHTAAAAAAATSPHVLQFLSAAGAGGMLGSQPLAALHSMAERSHHQQQTGSGQGPHSHMQMAQSGHQLAQHQGQGSPTGSGKHSPATSITSVGSNPHGIDSILSRPAATHLPAPGVHALPPAPHPQQLSTPRYTMHAGFTSSTGRFP